MVQDEPAEKKRPQVDQKKHEEAHRADPFEPRTPLTVEKRKIKRKDESVGHGQKTRDSFQKEEHCTSTSTWERPREAA